MQFRALVTEFRKAGLQPDSAVRIARILGNSMQEMRRGPATTDTTPRSMRQVTPDKRQHQLTNLDFKEGDPDHRKTRLQATEEKVQPTQASTVQTEQSPQETSSPFHIAGGNYVETKSGGGAVGVGLRVNGTGQFLTQNGEANALAGSSLRAEAECGREGLIRFFIEERAEEHIFKLQFSIVALQAIIYETIFEALGMQPTDPNNPTIPTPPPLDDTFVSVELTNQGLCFIRRNNTRVCIPIEEC